MLKLIELEKRIRALEEAAEAAPGLPSGIVFYNADTLNTQLAEELGEAPATPEERPEYEERLRALRDRLLQELGEPGAEPTQPAFRGRYSPQKRERLETVTVYLPIKGSN